MHQYRQVIVRMRLGESDRALAKAGLMGRRKAMAVRRLAEEQGWLDPSQPLPDDATLAEVLARPSSPAQSTSLVLPHQEQVTDWWKQGIQGTTIHQALVRCCRSDYFTGHLSRYFGADQAHVPALNAPVG